MKLRLLVMNGSRIVQTEEGGGWHNNKVEKAGAIRPGIYNLYTATKADKSQQHDGQVVHADPDYVFQQVGKNFVMHDRSDFDKVPEIGSVKRIAYGDTGRATVSSEVPKLGRGRSR